MIGTEIVSPPHIMITELLTTVFISYWFSYHGVTGLEYHENIWKRSHYPCSTFPPSFMMYTWYWPQTSFLLLPSAEEQSVLAFFHSSQLDLFVNISSPLCSLNNDLRLSTHHPCCSSMEMRTILAQCNQRLNQSQSRFSPLQPAWCDFCHKWWEGGLRAELKVTMLNCVTTMWLAQLHYGNL